MLKQCMCEGSYPEAGMHFRHVAALVRKHAFQEAPVKLWEILAQLIQIRACKAHCTGIDKAECRQASIATQHRDMAILQSPSSERQL